MNALVSRRALIAALKLALPGVDKLGALPFRYVWLEVIENHLRVRTYNAEIAIDVTVRAEGRGATEGSVFVPMSRLLRVLSAMEDDEIHLVAISGRLVLGGRRQRMQMLGLAEKIGDVMPESGPPPLFSLPLAEGQLHGIIRPVYHAASYEETRYYLNGVCLQNDSDGKLQLLRTIATNGHMLESRATGVLQQLPNLSVIIPHVAVKAILQTSPDVEARLELFGDEKRPYHIGRYVGDNFEIRFKLIDGTYPDWRRVVPDVAGGAFVDVSALELRRALRFVRSSIGGSFRCTCLLPISDSEIGLRYIEDGGDYITTARIPGTSTPDLKDKPFVPVGLNAEYLATLVETAVGTLRIKQSSTDLGPIVLQHEGIPYAVTLMMPMRMDDKLRNLKEPEVPAEATADA
ncbi:hypothetical protein BA190_09500 [Labrys sp. WJW]|uniref:DNA polymerase III subunit beta n=1 Tax=Labrys sp. WJW TaxID=1737983 RepID=UPI000835D77B|nr:DNA polymerase III subunit beta [Labrys sp. WJW]OCC05141.1 hypothetical protein BA190_09500 [Labrys sp. WJW]